MRQHGGLRLEPQFRGQEACDAAGGLPAHSPGTCGLVVQDLKAFASQVIQEEHTEAHARTVKRARQDLEEEGDLLGGEALLVPVNCIGGRVGRQAGL